MARIAQLGQPWGWALDRARHLYLADTDNHRVRRIDAHTGVIVTVAGIGTGGYAGDGGPATLASLKTPHAVALDAADNLYIADTGNHRVRKLSLSTGVITTLAGTGTAGAGGNEGPATLAQLNRPFGIAFDHAGGLLVAEEAGHRVRRFSHLSPLAIDAAPQPSGLVLGREWRFRTRATGGAGRGLGWRLASGNLPPGILMDSGTPFLTLWGKPTQVGSYSFTLQVTDPDCGVATRSFELSVSGQIITTIAGNGVLAYSGDGGPATAASLALPADVAVGPQGEVYIADTANHRIRSLDPITGLLTTVAGDGTAGYAGDGGPGTSARLSAPEGLDVDRAGNVLIADTGNAWIRRLNARDGTIESVVSTGLTRPSDLALDGAAHIYIADRGAHRVYQHESQTDLLTSLAGLGTAGYSGDGGPSSAAGLSSPTGVAIGTPWTLYIADTGNHRVRVVDLTTLIIRTAAGDSTGGYSGDGGAATSARLRSPVSVAVDSAGNLYIADQGNHALRRVEPGLGLISTVAGDGTSGFVGDGGPPSAARLNTVSGIAVDPSGRVYLADSLNQRVRRIAP